MKKFSLFYSTISLMIFIAIANGCAGGKLDAAGENNNPVSPTRQGIIIDQAGSVPVFGNLPTSSIIYVHNTIHKILNVSYFANDSNQHNLNNLPTYSLKNSFQPGLNTQTCTIINPGQSCPLSFTTATPTGPDFSGSLSITAKFSSSDGSIQGQYSQIINYATINNQAIKGINFGGGTSITNNNPYATIYAYGGDINKLWKVNSLYSYSANISITSGNVQGMQMASNSIQPIELKLSDSVKQLQTSTLLYLSSSDENVPEKVYTASVPLTGIPVTNQALITMGNPPVVNTSSTQTGVIYILNSGNVTATGLSISAGTDLSQTNNCGTDLASNATCTINFNVISSKPTGSSTITMQYNNGTNTTTSIVTVSWYSEGSALLAINISPSPLSFNATQSQAATITITNVGKVAVSNLSVPPPTIVSGTGIVATEEPNTCAGTNLAIGFSCSFIIRASATSKTSGSINVSIAGEYYNGDTLTSYSRITNLLYTAAPYGATLNITLSPTSFVLMGDGVNSVMEAITITNTGSAPALISSESLTNNSSSPMLTTTLSGSSCIGSLAVGDTCTTRTITIGPYSNNTGLIRTFNAGTFAYNLTYSGGETPSTKLSTNYNGTINPGVNLSVESYIESQATSGSGTSASPFIFSGSNSNTKTITVVYKNNGLSTILLRGITDTNNTYVWTINTTSSTCYSSGRINKSLATNASCTVVYTNVLPQTFIGLGNIGSSYSNNLTLATITYTSGSDNLLYQQTPTTPEGQTQIYASSQQATLTTTVTETGSIATSDASISVTMQLANAAGYSSNAFALNMENYFNTGSGTCTINSASGGITIITCNLSSSTAQSSAILPISSWVTSGTKLHMNTSYATFIVPNWWSNTLTIN